ncbi:hypothetical protein IJG44_08190 [bacterium]|nr:hypothetical protein [bacterium]
MSPKRKVRASELATGRNGSSHWRYLILLIIVGGLFLYFMIKWTSDKEYDRFAAAKQYSDYYKDFFVEQPITYTVFEENKLVIRATNLGSEFWSKEFYAMIRQSENEVNEMLNVAKLINETHSKTGETIKEEQNLSSFPALYGLLETGKKMSEISYYNLASGEISGFWDRQYRNYKKKSTAYAKAEVVLNYLFDNPMLSPSEIQNRKKLLDTLTKEKTDSASSVEDIADQIYKMADKTFARMLKDALSKPSSISENEKKALLLNILAHIKIHSTIDEAPKFENAKAFVPYADPKKIELNDEKKSVKILSPNVSIDVNFFREALFMKQLKEKLPKVKFNYLIYLGDRHGMWKLPKEYVRWSVSIDDPFSVTDKIRGAIKLMPEEGYFVITRRNENVIMVRMEELSEKIRKDLDSIKEYDAKNAYLIQLKKDYPDKTYFFDPIKKTMFRKYDTPVDWRTAENVENNLAAFVIDEEDPVRARMLSYSLFISDDARIADHEKGFPNTIFAVLKNDSTVFVPEKHKELFMTPEDVKEAKIKADYKARGLNPDGTVPAKKK